MDHKKNEEEKVETIGNVKLNLEFYSGQDLYSDGDIEDRLLDIVKNHGEEEFNQIIKEKQDWAIMYHLSPIRANIVGSIHLDRDASVLELGAGCGAITGALADQAGSVTCVDLSKRRSQINAYRNKNRKNIEILVGNFQDIEQSLGLYDCITLIGVFEYGASYIHAANPYEEFLRIIKKHLKPDGKIVMAIENKFGMKYFAGCREDHFGTFFEGIENYANTSGIRTFSKTELEKLFDKAGFETYKFYYPYPDYKFPMRVYSDAYLPKMGELTSNIRNFDRDRMLLFDEAKAFDSVIQDGMFPYFSNSYLVEIGRADNPVQYKKYSNDRSERFSICTEIRSDESVRVPVDSSEAVRKYSYLTAEASGEYSGLDTVVKSAAFPQSEQHVRALADSGEKLRAQYAGSKLSVCESVWKDGAAHSPFLSGRTLEEICDEWIEKGQPEKAEAIIRELIALILDKNADRTFEKTDAFTEVFGHVEFQRKMRTGGINDIDMVLNNIIEQDGSWKLIDYEWTFNFPVPAEFIIYRLLHYYFAANQKRAVLKEKDYLSLSEEDLRMFRKMEAQFQQYINGSHSPMEKLYATIGKAVVDPNALQSRHVHKIKIYKDFGEGYLEYTASVLTLAAGIDGRIELKLDVEPGVLRYLIAPYERGCVIRVKKVQANGWKIPFNTNGAKLEENLFVYADDPWLEVETKGKSLRNLVVEYYMDTQISQDCGAIVKSMEDGCYEMLMSYPPFKIKKKLHGFRKKSIGKIKLILKSNPVTHRICKEIKETVKKWTRPKEEESVEKIVSILCPQEEWQRQRNTEFPRKVKVSILVPLYNTPERYLKEMIESVQYQSYENWELCLADGSDAEHGSVEKICRKYSSKDGRIKYRKLEKNLGISDNTNACVDMAEGDFIALFDHDDFLHPSALYEVMKAICDHQADYVYTDEATFEGTNIFHIVSRHCKPDFAIDNLRANNYICHFSVFDADLLKKAGRFRSEYDGSQDFDLILRLTEQAKKVFHIRKTLYYWRSHPASVASDISAKTYAIDAAKRAVESHMERMGLQAEVTSSEAFPVIFRIRYALPRKPMISIVIPNRDHREDLEKCVHSILEKSNYDNYEILIIENNSFKEETFACYKELEEYEKISVLYYPEEAFNYAAINNFAAKKARGEYLLLLNNDTEVISPEWMEELMMYGQRSDVAAVGAKLYYGNDTIQHAGIVIGLGADRAAGHSHYGDDRRSIGYMGRLYYAQEVSAVTGACMLVKKSIYEELGGMDEQFAVAFNDVDFCLRAREKGYLNVFTPYCELYHYESVSRGAEQRDKKLRFDRETRMFKERWERLIEEGDPYYNPAFSLDRPDFHILQ
ncbi:MAG: glycosyltransferase [Clostridiales bacterium]|nr:glycosyltransferase [Clostridiales bacterium]